MQYTYCIGLMAALAKVLFQKMFIKKTQNNHAVLDECGLAKSTHSCNYTLYCITILLVQKIEL
jgi:hypothetical protein